jgi:hypothetical protein
MALRYASVKDDVMEFERLQANPGQV